MNKKYRWRVLYYPPIKDLDDEDITTWRKVFFIDRYECPTKLDLDVKVRELKNLYQMKDEYTIVEELNWDE